MKTVKTKADLARVAIGRGAAAKMADGRVINAARDKQRVAKPVPKVEPPPPPPEKDDAIPKALARLAETIASRPEPQPTAPCGYRIEIVERDSYGYTKTIVVTPL